MASGALDYWPSSSNKMAGMMDSILAGLFSGAELLTALETIDVPGILTALEAGNTLLTLLEGFSTSDIVTALAAQSVLLEHLDALDGIVDGQLTLAQLTGVQAELLAKLTGIDTGQVDAATLLGKLDALDGTMDGKLDLAKLKEAITGEAGDSVFGQLKASVTALASSLTKLDTQIERLVDIKDNTSPMIVMDETIYEETTAGGEVIMVGGVFPNRKNIRILNSIGSHERIYVGYTDIVNQTNYTYLIEPGSRQDISSTGQIWVYMWHAGIYWFKVWDTG